MRFGIPVLTASGVTDPYLSSDEDLRAAERLADHGAREGFEGALAAYYATNARVSPIQARRFIAGTIAALGRARTVFDTWREWTDGGRVPENGTLIDVGCGTGPLAVTTALAGYQTVGVDVGLRWLVLASLRAREAGADVTFVCAGAEALPLADGAAAIVVGESVFENVRQLDRAVNEVARVLQPGGWLWFTTANRWSLGPDPHLGLPLGGWLPPGLTAFWARHRNMVPPQRRLLGALGVRRLLARHGFQLTRLGPPPIAQSQLEAASGPIRLAVRVYEGIRRVPPGSAFLRAFGPTLVAVAHR
ncbi:MAG TPA: class I SAM-dependent methyltransferase [Gemmatimonadaceae bacterium]